MNTSTRIDQTVIEFFNRSYVPERLPDPSKQASRETYRTEIRNLDRFANESLGRSCRVGDLCDELLAGAMSSQLNAGRKPATANKLFRHIKSIWCFARDHRDVPLPPCRLKPLKEERREPEAWFPSDLAAIVEAASRRRGTVGSVQASVFWKAVVMVQISTGIRIRAQLSLPVSDYDRDRQELRAPAELQKQRRDQWMQLLPSAAESLEALAPWDRGLPTLFGDWPFDGGGRPDCLRRHLKKLLVEAGLYSSVKEIPPYRHTWHKFRRSFATQVAASAGKDTARELLGHSTLSVTERYLDRRQLPRPSVTELIADPVEPKNPPPSPTLRIFSDYDTAETG